MNDAIARIVGFVEGRIEPSIFESCLSADPEIECELSDDPALQANTYVGSNTYLFVIEQDFDSPMGLLNAHTALSEFLERKRISFKPTKEYAELSDILLKAQPPWLDVPANWLKKNVLSAAEGRRGKELRDWLRSRLLGLFRYREKPPRWIQCPNWPIGEHGPLVFLGQMKISNYFHDEAAAYVFHDPTTGDCETVIQTY